MRAVLMSSSYPGMDVLQYLAIFIDDTVSPQNVLGGATMSLPNFHAMLSSSDCRNSTTIMSTLATMAAGFGITAPSSFFFANDQTQVNSDWNAVSGVSQILNKPAIPSGSSFVPSVATRSLNTAFQISSTYGTFVTYGVDIAATLTLTGGATGTVTLQYADDSGFTTNVKTVQTSANGNTGTLTIGLALTQTATATVTGFIPAGKYVRIATANTTGIPTFTYRNGQETQVQF